MSSKVQKILAIIFMVIPSLMLIMSGVMKIMGGEQIIAGLTKAGYGPYIKIFGIAEILFVVLFWIPKTYKIGFYFILSYLLFHKKKIIISCMLRKSYIVQGFVNYILF